MSTAYRPLMREPADKPVVKFRWTDIIELAVLLLVVIWASLQHDWILAGFILSFVLPGCLCRKFVIEQDPEKSVGSILGKSKPLMVTCWVVAIVVITLAVLAGLGVQPFSQILVPWPDAVWLDNLIFQSVPVWLKSLFLVVFSPVFIVAIFIEKRMWLRLVWASAASAIALAILYFSSLVT